MVIMSFYKLGRLNKREKSSGVRFVGISISNLKTWMVKSTRNQKTTNFRYKNKSKSTILPVW